MIDTFPTIPLFSWRCTRDHGLPRGGGALLLIFLERNVTRHWFSRACDENMSSLPDDARLGPSMRRRIVAEMIATMVKHFVASTSGYWYAESLITIALVYHTARVSGAHLNPAVSLTFMLLGHISPVEMMLYWASQVGGATIGALLTRALVPDGWVTDSYHPGCFIADPMVTRLLIFWWEAIMTMCQIVPVMSVVWYTQNKSGYGNTGPIMIGIAEMAAVATTHHWTGGCVNPARALAAMIVSGCSNASVLPIYVAGELLGGLLAPLMVIPLYGVARNPWFMPAIIWVYSRSEWAGRVARSQSIGTGTGGGTSDEDSAQGEDRLGADARGGGSSPKHGRTHNVLVPIDVLMSPSYTSRPQSARAPQSAPHRLSIGSLTTRTGSMMASLAHRLLLADPENNGKDNAHRENTYECRSTQQVLQQAWRTHSDVQPQRSAGFHRSTPASDASSQPCTHAQLHQRLHDLGTTSVPVSQRHPSAPISEHPNTHHQGSTST